MSKKSEVHIKKVRGERFTREIRGMDLNQVLIVPIDIAKQSHRALVANYFGDIIVEPFTFENTIGGAKLLEVRIDEAARQARAKKIFIAMESTGHYGENLSRYLKSRSFCVLGANPYAVSMKRQGSLTWCKTDDIDLCAIGSLVLDNVVTEASRTSGVYYNLRIAARARRKAVFRMGRLKTEIRCILDRLFPGLEKLNCFGDIGTRGVREFLKCNPTPQRVLMMGEGRLVHVCRTKKIQFSEQDVSSILRVAKDALSREEGEQEILVELLNEKLQELDQLEGKIKSWEVRMGQYFVQTPGVWLLRMTNVGVVAAAEFIGETGDPSHFQKGDSYIRYAGLEPRKNRSGKFESSMEPITKLGSGKLRYIATIIAQNVVWKNVYFKTFANRLIDKGKEINVARVAVGCKFLKIAHPIMVLKERFVPPESFSECFNNDIEKKVRTFFETHRAGDSYEKILPALRQELKNLSKERSRDDADAGHDEASLTMNDRDPGTSPA